LAVVYGIAITIFYGIFFTFLQLYEYFTTDFTIAETSFGSIFFLGTGFHGLHVLVGTIFLIVCFYRVINRHFTVTHHIGFECAILY
jgi:heme/copper-type cytochrome/quinol oxidase subunit 3